MSYETDDKMVSHPDHYQSGKYEVIDIIEEFTKDLSGIEAVDTGNAIKYVLRWHKKNGVQDIKKAIWYLTHLAEYLEEKENPSKPHSVVIHKLTGSGHYAIEDLKDDESEKNCTNCGHKGEDDICQDCIVTPESVKPTNWMPKEEIDKEDPSEPLVDGVADAVSDNPDDPCPCHAKHCSSPESCCGCDDYDKWKERQK